MATFQVFSSGPGSAQGSLGWALPPTGWPQGRLTERQYEDSEWWHVHFRKFQPSEGSDPLQSLHTIKESLNLWMRPDMRSTQQILDQLVLEKFMTCMPLELQVLVRERKVQSCEELEALLRKKEKPRKWRVLTIQGREYLLENSEEDLVLDLSMKSSTPISEAGEHSDNSPEDLGEPENQPGPSDVAWGQRMVAVEEQEYSDEEVWDTPLVIDLSARSPSPISEAGEHPDNSPEEYPTHVPEVLNRRQKRGGPRTPRAAPKRKRGNTPTVQAEPQEPAVTSERGQVVGQHGSDSVGDQLTVQPTGHPVRKEPGRQIPYECEDCSKRFSYKSQFDLHRRTHTGERPFPCPSCVRRFIQASDLKVHQRIHTGQKPFGCAVCGKRFTHASTLRGHLRVHTRERPFQCGDCNKRFSHRGNLNVHLRTHSGVRPYRCPRCDGAFRQLGTFQRHQRTCRGAPRGRRDPADPGVQPRVPSGVEMVPEHVDT
ncbi:zinc finger and SCAN domain-containing protein 5B [Pipistrellus kuhlii]|uniref:Zinc finger and SCAN domain containing 5B n=1 Tax=Pipistrellus kuhlii TaxID=59472 RepID=A0A7J7QXD1_PIPKU|nr:zinc finger and SCAN domain-containing protein 5B [Pipistrellus kuhlii]KAF6268427.1 hypothetical protein mPipKuh1_019481 [Pipistrellus kuhlii]